MSEIPLFSFLKHIIYSYLNSLPIIAGSNYTVDLVNLAWVIKTLTFVVIL